MSSLDDAGGAALAVADLCKSYKKNPLVNDHVSISLERGEVFGLLGPNGAGKTTLVSQVIGLAKPDSGRIVIEGVDTVANPDYARQACSFQAQTQVPITGLTAKQAIELVGRVRGGAAKQVRERARDLLKQLEMEEWARKQAYTFSGGMQRLVAFCMAAVVPGRIVILDEPTNDIDPLRRRLLWEQVRDLVDRGCAVLLVTHNVLEAERAVDRLAIINKGKVIRTGTPASLKGGNGESMQLELVLEPRSQTPELPVFLEDPVVTGRRVIGRLREVDMGPAIQWARGLKEQKVAEEYSVGPLTLEDVYLAAVGHDEGNAGKGSLSDIEGGGA
ncbi:MAG: ABC transporter ATP-binding protein [Thermoleophilia bacterium]|nr:ABC transporter ATP-binding protein [Thermoleophilia bacterium]